DMLVDPRHRPTAARFISAALVWLSEQPLTAGRRVLLMHTTREVLAEVTTIEARLDIATLAESPATQLGQNEIGRAGIAASAALFCDTYEVNRQTGSFIVVDPASSDTLAVGMIREACEAATKTEGFAVWFTG